MAGYHIQRVSQVLIEGNKDYGWLHKHLANYPPYSDDEEREQLKIIKHGKIKNKKTKRMRKATDKEVTHASQEFIMHNMRLVLSIVSTKKKHYDPATMDLIAAGVDGLYVALDKFDTSYGTKFSTYATQWVKQKITRKLCNIASDSRVSKAQSKKEYDDAVKLYKSVFNKNPSDAEVFDLLDWSEDRIMRYMLGTDERLKVPIEVEQASEECDPNLIDHEDHFASLVWHEKLLELEAHFDKLSGLEKLVIQAIYGYQCEEGGLKYKDVEAMFDEDKEFIKKIERRALKKLWFFFEFGSN